MIWAGITIALGLVALAAQAGGVGWVLVVVSAVWLWRRG